MTPLDARARDLVSRLPSPAVGVEVGVFRGQFSEQLLRLHPTLQLYMVDPWIGTHQPRQSRSQEALIAEARRRTAFAAGRGRVMRFPSVVAAGLFDDASLDFVFIDGDHTYEGCAADIAAWLPKVRPGGLLSGHDYWAPFTNARHYGVVQAVDEAVAAHGWTLELGPDTCWYVRLP